MSPVLMKLGNAIAGGTLLGERGELNGWIVPHWRTAARVAEFDR